MNTPDHAPQLDKLRQAWAALQAPDHLLHGFALWLSHGIPPGGFASAVLENDLTEAVLRADDAAARHLSVVVWALRSAMPAAAWGSFDRVATWAAHRGLSGLQGAAQGLGQGNPDP